MRQSNSNSGSSRHNPSSTLPRQDSAPSALRRPSSARVVAVVAPPPQPSPHAPTQPQKGGGTAATAMMMEMHHHPSDFRTPVTHNQHNHPPPGLTSTTNSFIMEAAGHLHAHTLSFPLTRGSPRSTPAAEAVRRVRELVQSVENNLQYVSKEESTRGMVHTMLAERDRVRMEALEEILEAKISGGGGAATTKASSHSSSSSHRSPARAAAGAPPPSQDAVRTPQPPSSSTTAAAKRRTERSKSATTTTTAGGGSRSLATVVTAAVNARGMGLLDRHGKCRSFFRGGGDDDEDEDDETSSDTKKRDDEDDDEDDAENRIVSHASDIDTFAVDDAFARRKIRQQQESHQRQKKSAQQQQSSRPQCAEDDAGTQDGDFASFQHVAKSKASGYIEQLLDVGVYMRDVAETLVNALRNTEVLMERVGRLATVTASSLSPQQPGGGGPASGVSTPSASPVATILLPSSLTTASTSAGNGKASSASSSSDPHLVEDTHSFLDLQRSIQQTVRNTSKMCNALRYMSKSFLHLEDLIEERDDAVGPLESLLRLVREELLRAKQQRDEARRELLLHRASVKLRGLVRRARELRGDQGGGFGVSMIGGAGGGVGGGMYHLAPTTMASAQTQNQPPGIAVEMTGRSGSIMVLPPTMMMMMSDASENPTNNNNIFSARGSLVPGGVPSISAAAVAQQQQPAQSAMAMAAAYHGGAGGSLSPALRRQSMSIARNAFQSVPSRKGTNNPADLDKLEAQLTHVIANVDVIVATVVQIAIADYDVLWERSPFVMRQAVRLFNEMVDRVAKAYDASVLCYRSRGSMPYSAHGGYHLLLFRSPLEASQFAASLHVALLLAPWPEQLTASKQATSATGNYEGADALRYAATVDCDDAMLSAAATSVPGRTTTTTSNSGIAVSSPLVETPDDVMTAKYLQQFLLQFPSGSTATATATTTTVLPDGTTSSSGNSSTASFFEYGVALNAVLSCAASVAVPPSRVHDLFHRPVQFRGLRAKVGIHTGVVFIEGSLRDARADEPGDGMEVGAEVGYSYRPFSNTSFASVGTQRGGGTTSSSQGGLGGVGGVSSATEEADSIKAKDAIMGTVNARLPLLYGAAVMKAAIACGCAHGGETILSSQTFTVCQAALDTWGMISRPVSYLTSDAVQLQHSTVVPVANDRLYALFEPNEVLYQVLPHRLCRRLLWFPATASTSTFNSCWWISFNPQPRLSDGSATPPGWNASTSVSSSSPVAPSPSSIASSSASSSPRGLLRTTATTTNAPSEHTTTTTAEGIPREMYGVWALVEQAAKRWHVTWDDNDNQEEGDGRASSTGLFSDNSSNNTPIKNSGPNNNGRSHESDASTLVPSKNNKKLLEEGGGRGQGILQSNWKLRALMRSQLSQTAPKTETVRMLMLQNCLHIALTATRLLQEQRVGLVVRSQRGRQYREQQECLQMAQHDACSLHHGINVLQYLLARDMEGLPSTTTVVGHHHHHHHHHHHSSGSAGSTAPPLAQQWVALLEPEPLSQQLRSLMARFMALGSTRTVPSASAVTGGGVLSRSSHPTEAAAVENVRIGTKYLDQCSLSDPVFYHMLGYCTAATHFSVLSSATGTWESLALPIDTLIAKLLWQRQHEQGPTNQQQDTGSMLRAVQELLVPVLRSMASLLRPTATFSARELLGRGISNLLLPACAAVYTAEVVLPVLQKCSEAYCDAALLHAHATAAAAASDHHNHHHHAHNSLGSAAAALEAARHHAWQVYRSLQSQLDGMLASHVQDVAYDLWLQECAAHHQEQESRHRSAFRRSSSSGELTHASRHSIAFLMAATWMIQYSLWWAAVPTSSTSNTTTSELGISSAPPIVASASVALGELRDDTVQDWNSFAMSRSSSVCHFNTVPRWSPPPSSFPSPQANKSNQKQSKLGSAADGTTTTMPATSFVFDMSWFLQHALVSSHEWGAVHGSLFLQGKHDALLRTILESLSRSPSPLGCSAADGAVTTAASPLSAALLSGGGLPNAARSTDSARTPPGSATTNHLSPAATTALTPSLLLTSSSSPQGVVAAPSNVHAAGAMVRPSQYLEEKHLEHDRRIVRMSTTTDYRIVAVRDLLGATDSTNELWHHHTAGVAYQGFTILAESPSFPFPQLRDPRGEDEALRAPALLRRSMRKFLSRLSQLYTDARQQCCYLFPCVGVVDQDYRGGGSATPACGILYPDVSHRTAVAPMMKTLEQLFANATGLGGGGGGLDLHHHQQQQHYSSSSVYLPRRWSEGHVQSWGLSLAHALEALHSRHAAAGFVSPFTVFVPIEVSSSSFSSSHSNNNATLGGTVLLCEQAALFLWKQLCSSQAGHDARAVLLGPNSHSHHQATGGSANADSSHSPAMDATKLQTVPLEVLAGFLPPELLAQLSTRTDTGNDASAYTNQFIGEWVCGTLYGAIKKTSSSSSSAHAADMAEEARRPSVGTDPHFPQQEGTPSPSSLDTTSEVLVDLKAADVYMFGATLWWIATGGVSLYEFLSIHHPHPSSSSSYAAAAPSSSPYGGRLGDASQQPSRTSAASGRSPREGAFGVHTTLPQAATKHLESLEAYDNHVFQSTTRHAAHQTASFSAAPQQPQQQRIVVEPLQPQLLGGGTSAPQQQQQQQAWGKKYYATPNLFGSAGQLMRQLRLSLMRAKVARVKPPYDVHALFPDTAASHASYNKKEQPPATTTTASFPNTTESQSHRENSTTSASMPPSDALPLLKFEGQARSASFVLLCDLLHACLQRDPSHRPSMREVLRHPFFAVVPVAPLQLPHHVDIALPTFLHLQHVVSSSSAVVDPSPSSPSAANYHNSMDAVSSPSAAVVTPSSLTAAAAPVHPWYALAPHPSLLPPTTSSPSQQGSPTSTAASAALRPPLPIPSEGFLECVDGSSMLQTVPNGFVLHGDLVRNAGKHAVSDVTPGVQLLVVHSDPSHTARRDAAVAAVRAEALVAVAAAAESGRTEEGGNGVEVVRSMKQELSSHSLGLLFGY